MKILLFYHGGSLNRGCEAIVRSAIGVIKKEYPNAVIGLASMAPETDTLLKDQLQIHDARRITIPKYSWSWIKSALSVKLFNDEKPMHRFQNVKLLNLIPQYDIFLSIGGDNYCYGEQPWLYVVDEEIKKAGKKLVLWGASIGAEDLSPAKIEDLARFDRLLIRESFSFNALTQAGLSNVSLVADGAFTMEREELELPDTWQEGNTIGFNFSPLVYKLNLESKQAAYALVDHILATTTATVCFTPHVIIPGNDDFEIMQEFFQHYQATGRVCLLPGTLNAIQYKGYISRMRMFIGARTHATIAAYSTLVPTMVLGYSVKSKGIAFDIFGEEKLVLDKKELANATHLKAKFDELLQEEKTLKSILEQRIPYIREMAFKAGALLKEL